MTRHLAAACVASAVCLAACAASERPATQVVVTVDGDPELMSQLSAVRAFVYDVATVDEGKPSDQNSFLINAAPDAGSAAAFSFGIVRGANDTFKLVVKGYRSSELTAAPLIERKLLVSFRAHESVPIAVFLSSVCAYAAEACSGLGRTCAPVANELVAAGECGPIFALDDRSASTPPGSQPSSDAGLDAQVSHPQEMEPPLRDGGARERDGSASNAETGTAAGLSDASADAQVRPAPTGECAGINLCTLNAYPCVPSESVGYTCQGQFADWPMPDAAPGAKVAPSYELWSLVGVATDNVTGLSWQREVPEIYAGCSGTQVVPGDSCTLQEANAYCDQWAADGEHWRLPSKIELESILDETRRPALDTAVFLNPHSSMEFWTASPSIVVKLGQWSIDFADGTAGTRAPTEAHLVRCVRSRIARAARPQNRYVVDAQNDTVGDTFTGLTWQRTVLESDTSSEAARSHCESLEGGSKGWRVPAYKELLTLVDPTRSSPALDPVFPAVSQSWLFRSSSPNPAGTASDLLVSFYVGATNTQADVDLLLRASAIAPVTYHVRCVR